jgi:ABC-2 type transport system permease protein
MNPAVVSEYRKLRTLRLPAVILAATPVLAGLIAVVGVHALGTGEHFRVSDAARAVADPLWFLVAVVAILASAGEFQHRTIRSTLLATPRRTSVLLAKGAVIAGYGALVTSLGAVTAAVAGVVTAHLDGTVVDGGGAAAWVGVTGAVLAGALFAVLAGGLGMLTRSTALALTTLLLWRFVGEGVLPVVLRRPVVSDWTPTGVARTVVAPWHDVAPALGSGAVLVGYVAVVVAAAALVFLRRDPA